MESAQRAFDASSGLGREARLNVEGNLYSAQRDWPKAIEVYRTLSGFFADNVEYGLRLAEAQSAGGKHKDALATLDGRARVRCRNPIRDSTSSNRWRRRRCRTIRGSWRRSSARASTPMRTACAC